jgi:hypothetical protein
LPSSSNVCITCQNYCNVCYSTPTNCTVCKNTVIVGTNVTASQIYAV